MKTYGCASSVNGPCRIPQSKRRDSIMASRESTPIYFGIATAIGIVSLSLGLALAGKLYKDHLNEQEVVQEKRHDLMRDTSQFIWGVGQCENVESLSGPEIQNVADVLGYTLLEIAIRPWYVNLSGKLGAFQFESDVLDKGKKEACAELITIREMLVSLDPAKPLGTPLPYGLRLKQRDER